MPELILYHTDGCHLCEQAAAMLASAQLPFIHQDICDDEALAERYGISIPVLARQDSEQELCWPFDLAAVVAFVGE
ncbi:glutaredoxin family protein [Shewanella sp. NIFS-20-20]|uniref:glutaredoxin family protein n=1 Tax=Shewanella sp. NIFS-20-20 TaxID=2853806 RepID=UPI001C43A671|nr:glutaredoxin family protein [Shewanella sp. NIFS-20-20]MBV7317486.1 glutaredoxin family protein [Shewanella sp. NIFS-20-20]